MYQPLYIDACTYANKITTFGRTKDGLRVVAHIINFKQYFYVDASNLPDKKVVLANLNELDGKCAHRIYDIKEINDKKTIYGYTDKHLRLFKVTVNRPCDAKHVTGLFERYYEKLKHHIVKRDLPSCLNFYDNNCPVYLSKFYANTGFRPSTWCQLKKFEQVIYIPDIKLEVNVDYRELTSIPDDYDGDDSFGEPRLKNNWSSIAPFTIFVFDIECVNRFKPRGFPDPVVHPISTISISYRKAVGENEPIERTVLTLHKAAGESRAYTNDVDKTGFKVKCFETEYELLAEFGTMLRELDPDIISGYNADQFDFNYIAMRASIWCVESLFRDLSKIKDRPFYINDFMKRMTESRVGTNKNVYSSANLIIMAYGFVVLDCLTAIKDTGTKFKCDSYKLDLVASELFKGQEHTNKQDMPYHLIGETFYGSPEGVSKLASYCMTDTDLTLMIIDKQKIVYDYIEKSRTYALPIDDVLTRGKSIRAINLYAIKVQVSRKGLFLFPDDIPEFANLRFWQDKQYNDIVDPELQEFINMISSATCKKNVNTKARYSGAVVMEPETGFYTGKDMVTTNDFNALYPRIIKQNNKCVSTMTTKENLLRIHPDAKPNEDYRLISGTGVIFVSEKIQRGLIPEVIDDLLKSRMTVKNKLKREKDPEKKIWLDLKQKNIKIVTNSLYGLLGTETNPMNSNAIAASITWQGGLIIMLSKYVIEKHFPDAKVIYGDTDSTFTLFRNITLGEIMKRANIINDLINSDMSTGDLKLDKFISVILAHSKKKEVHLPPWFGFEKVLQNMVLCSKKRYAGRIHETDEKSTELFTKGIETVRRDGCAFIRQVLQDSLYKLIVEDDKEGGIECVRRVVAALHADNGSGIIIPPKLYARRGAIKAENYVSSPVQDIIRKRIMQTNPTMAPGVGDNVLYLICTRRVGDKKNKEKGLSLDEYASNRCPIEKKYYLDSLKKVIKNTWKHVIDNVDAEMFNLPCLQQPVMTMHAARAAKQLIGLPVEDVPALDLTDDHIKWDLVPYCQKSNQIAREKTTTKRKIAQSICPVSAKKCRKITDFFGS